VSAAPQTVRAASQADSLISDMRALVQVTEPIKAPAEGAELERIVAGRVVIALMLTLLLLVFVTSAIPDIGPSLAAAVGAHL
jgi:hypothetical protein